MAERRNELKGENPAAQKDVRSGAVESGHLKEASDKNAEAGAGTTIMTGLLRNLEDFTLQKLAAEAESTSSVKIREPSLNLQRYIHIPKMTPKQNRR